MRASSGFGPRDDRSLASRAGGFTLTELLVLVSLGIVLAGAILPALNKAQDTVKAAVCLSNMHQWGVAIGLYTADQNDYYPYDGYFDASPCVPPNTNAWFNVLPPYINQPKLCDLYIANTPPTPLTKGLWTCPSATNVTVSPTMANPFFMYAFSVCLHQQGNTNHGFKRSRMVSPATTIIFCEEDEDAFPETSGEYATVTRHFGGSHFAMGDGHAEWVAFGNFCRAGNPGCPAPLGNIQWNDSGHGGDWNPAVAYHWWMFLFANTSPN